MTTGRRVVIGSFAAAALLAAGAGAGPAQATTTVTFRATFSEFLCGATFCGTGVVAQFGSASILFTTLIFTPPCEFDATITVTGGTLKETHGCLGEKGGPFTVMGGTGVFAGASGGGTVNCVNFMPALAHDTRCVYKGTLTLP